MRGINQVIGLALKGISKRFGNTLVLDNVSLNVGVNEFLVVLGPSGCGKSTLLRAVAGLESIDSGAIEIDGQRVDHLPPGKRGVAMVFQSYALYPHMTVRENISFGLVNVGVGRAEIERAYGSGADSGNAAAAQPVAAELSAQRQRVAIGRAIVEPKVFMFDEPLSNLDAALRSRTRQEIANIHRRIRKTTVFVTHDQTEAMTLADRIVVMNRQCIEQVGTPSEIYGNPATLFVATFVGSPAMNVLPVARVHTEQALQRVMLGDGTVIDTVVPVAAAAAEGPLRVGLRPESIKLCAPGQGLTNAKVISEFMGDKSFLFVVADECRLGPWPMPHSLRR